MLKTVLFLVFRVPIFSTNGNMINKLSFVMSMSLKLYPGFREEGNKRKVGRGREKKGIKNIF